MNQGKKMMAGIIASAVLLFTGVVLGGYFLADKKENFPADGYILEIGQEGGEQKATELTFSSGTQYRGKFPGSYTFRDIQGQKSTVEGGSYIHYNDGSLSALSDGVIVNMEEAGQGFLEFYKVGRGMVLTRVEQGWEIDNNGNMMGFPELLWQLSEDKLLTASDNMTMEFGGNEPIEISGYLEVTWIDKNIVQAANKEGVYQMIASDAKITFSSGSVLDLAQRAVIGKDKAVSFTMRELQADLDGGAIAIRSDSAFNWTPPTFNIQTVDGENGRVGEGGDDGEDGEIGKTGETGKDGDDGQIGANAAEGTKGAVGAVGATGATAGTTGVGQAGRSIGLIRVADLQYDCASISKLSLAVDDDDDTLGNDGIIEVRDAQTNRSLKTIKANLKPEGLVDNMLTWGERDFSNILIPNHEYILLVSNDYKIGDDDLPGRKTFIKRSFFTNAEGVTMSVQKQEETGVILKFQDLSSSYTGAARVVNRCILRIKSDNYFVNYPAYGGAADISALVRNGLTLDIAGLFQSKYSNVKKWNMSDIPYTIELYTGKESSTWTLTDGVPVQGIEAGNVTKSAQILEGRTLKKQPVLGTITTALADGYYDLTQIVTEDADNSIRNYKFQITHGNDVEVLESVSNKVRWYFKDALLNEDYKVTCEVTYYDNEKTTVIKSDEKTISLKNEGRSVVEFLPYTLVVGSNGEKQWKDKENSDIVATGAIGQAGSSSCNPTRIWGKLNIIPNDLNIVPGSEVRIEVKSDVTHTSGFGEEENYGLNYRRVYTFDWPTSPTTKYSFPIKCLGLKANTTYTISVFGQVKYEKYSGSATQEYTQEMCLGTASYTTKALGGTDYSETESLVKFRVTSMYKNPANTDPQNLYAKIELVPGDDDLNLNSANYFERSIARWLIVEVWEGSGNAASYRGTILKDMYEGENIGLDSGWESTDAESKTTTGDIRAEGRFFNGPLVRGNNVSFKIERKDLAGMIGNPKIDPDSFKAVMTLKIVGMCDYAYGLMDDFDKTVNSQEGRADAKKFYEDHFAAGVQRTFEPLSSGGQKIPRYYNLMRLNAVKINSTSQELCNIGEIDFGQQTPMLVNPADDAVAVTEIKLNNGEQMFEGNLDSSPYYTDSMIRYAAQGQEKEIVGYKLQSAYTANASSKMNDVASITYYGMTLDDYLGYKNTSGLAGIPDGGDTSGGIHDPGRDIIKANRNSDGTQIAGPNQPIKFAVTIPIAVLPTDTDDYYQKPVDGDPDQNYTVDGAAKRAYVPSLYVFFTKNPDLLKQCQTPVVSGNNIVSYTFKAKKEKVEKGGKTYYRAVLYTDVLPRGHAYVFAYTLRSMYGVNMLSDEKPWEFPYEIADKTGSTSYSIEDMQRSKPYNLLKRMPQAAAYLDHTDYSGGNNKAVWQYYVWDPDNAFAGRYDAAAGKYGDLRMPGTAPDTGASDVGTFSFAGRAFTGTAADRAKQIADAMLGKPDMTIPNERAEAEKRLQVSLALEDPLHTSRTESGKTYNVLNDAVKAVMRDSFQVSVPYYGNSWEEELWYQSLKKFTVTVSDSTVYGGAKLDNPSYRDYGITLSLQRFDDYYMGNGKSKRAYYTKTAGAAPVVTAADSNQMGTVSHRFDAIKTFTNNTPGKDGRFETAIFQRAGTDTIQIRVNDSNIDADLRRRITGVYYELYELANEGATVSASARPTQWGFKDVKFDVEDKILLTGLQADKYAAVRVWAVYDTGRAGMRLPDVTDNNLRSNTHNLRDKTLTDWDGNAETSGAQNRGFYAMQMQSQTADQGGNISWQYVKKTAAGDQSYSAADEWASGSVYAVKKDPCDSDDPLNQSGNGNYKDGAYLFRLWNSTAAFGKRYGYTAAGADLYTYNTQGYKWELNLATPVFKALAEAPLTLNVGASGGRLTTNASDPTTAYFTVPMSKPNIDRLPITSGQGVHSADVTLHFSDQTVANLTKSTSAYGNKVYFKLYEGNAVADQTTGEIQGGKAPLTNTKNKYFTTRGAADSKGGYAQVSNNAPGTTDGYIEIESGKNDYTIPLRNLGKNKTYTLAMYCKEVGGNAVMDVLDVSDTTSTDRSVEKKAYAVFTTWNDIAIEGKSAYFSRKDYDLAELTCGYSMKYHTDDQDAKAPTDYYIKYTIRRVDPENYASIKEYSEDEVLQILGLQKETLQSTYYDQGTNSFRSRDYFRYKQADGTYIDPAAAVQDLKFTTAALDDSALLPPGEEAVPAAPDTPAKPATWTRYCIELHAYDMYTGNELTWQNPDTRLEPRVPRLYFDIWPRSNASPWASRDSIFYNETEGKGYMQLRFGVYDNGNRLSTPSGNAQTKRGEYFMVLSKKKGTEWEAVPPDQIERLTYSGDNIPTPTKSGAYETKSSVRVKLEVQANEKYRMQMMAYDIEKKANVVLYDSENNAFMKQKLEVPDFSAIDLGSVVDSFADGKLTLRSRGGQNLQKVTKWAVTMNVPDIGAYRSVSGTGSFHTDDENITIDLTERLADWTELRDGMILEIIVQFSSDDNQSVTWSRALMFTEYRTPAAGG